MGNEGQQLANSVGDEAYVQKAYLSTLGRPADPTGLQSYVARLRSGVPRSQILQELAISDEAKRFAAKQAVAKAAPRSAADVSVSLVGLLALDGAEFVRQAYLSVLGREADPTGLRDYSQRLSNGASKSQLLADLRCDPEGMAFDSKLPGLNNWVKLVQQLASVNDLLQLQGELFVYGAYLALFRREPDVEGLNRYLELMAAGASRTFILMELFKSAEAREKSASLRGLVGAISMYKVAQRKSWRGWYCRNVRGVESDLPADQERRAMHYRLYN